MYTTVDKYGLKSILKSECLQWHEVQWMKLIWIGKGMKMLYVLTFIWINKCNYETVMSWSSKPNFMVFKTEASSCCYKSVTLLDYTLATGWKIFPFNELITLSNDWMMCALKYLQFGELQYISSTPIQNWQLRMT